jgi:hypothetical protein
MAGAAATVALYSRSSPDNVRRLANRVVCVIRRSTIGLAQSDRLVSLLSRKIYALSESAWPSRDLRTSPRRNRSVSNARRWIDAFRLSIN